MKNSKRFATLVLVFILAVFSGCRQHDKEQSDAAIEKTSFRNVPGITQHEISAIEALQKKYGSFVYGINPTTEAFIGKDGEINGYAAMFCDWLSEMFGIKFTPKYYQWGDLLRGLESGEVDFTGELMSTSEDWPGYHMSSPTINRTIKSYRLRGSLPITEILRSHLPRYAFLREAVVADDVDANTEYHIVTVIVDSHAEAYRMLKSGEIDAFFGLDTAEGAFDVYGDVAGEEFFPLIFRSSCLSTHNDEFRPIINVLDKAMNDNVLQYLTELQKKGRQQYMENKIYTLLTEEERKYIKEHPVIPIGAEFSNYPISFCNIRTDEWQGIFFEALDEVSKLTGLSFELANDRNTPLLKLVDSLEKGEILILPELHQIKEYEGRFIWSDIPIIRDNFAIISRADYRNIDVNDIFHLHVAIRRETIYAEMFRKIFPAHRNFTEYETMEDTWEALGRDDVDVIFASRRRLVIYTNYYELADFKLNLVFNHTFDSFFTYNKDAAILKSIVDKALRVVNITNISNQWIYKTYDYRNKMAAAQRPWLIGALVMFLCVLSLVSVFLIKSRGAGKKLERLVARRTNDLAAETSKLMAILDSIPDLMFCKDKDLRYMQCNRPFEQFLGVTEEDVLNKSDYDGAWLSPEQVERIHNIEQTIINENRTLAFEEEVLSPFTGKKCVFETVKAPIRQDGTNVSGVIAVVRDITQRKETEKELAYQTSLFRTMLSSLPDAVFCKDLDFKYTLCNNYMALVINKKVEDLLGKNDVEALGLSPETAAIANETDKKVIAERQRVAYEEWVLCGDGITRLYETVKSPLILDDKVIGVMAIARDITHRKEMEEEVLAASRAKTAFLANMSHELRTPLNVIIGLTDLILEDEMSDQIKKNLVKISNAGTTLLSIVNDILDFSKIESGKLSLSPVEYYVSSLLNDIITLVVTRLGEKSVTFRLNIKNDLPNKLYGDDLRVKQILTNLLTNAVKYTNEGSIELKVDCKRDGDAVWMDVAVSDTGIGIRKEDLKNLFLDYYQVTATTNRNIEGTGLGLPITKKLVEMMDGELNVESEYGKGSTFSFRVKQGFVNDSLIGADVSDKLRTFCYSDDKRIVTRKLSRINLSYARVLVVDDMQTNLDVAAGILRKYQMQVDCLSNGLAAVHRIREGNPVYDAIFMDHMMPGMDGIETADKIRALGSEYAKKVPIIALTANAIQGTDKMFYEHDFQAFITKPIDVMEMDAVVRKWVRKDTHEGAAESEAQASGGVNAENENIDIKIPGVDTKAGLSRYAGEMDIYLPMLRSYAANTPETLTKLRAVSRETLPDYVITVHGLKGTSAGIGAEAIRKAALELETLSRAGDLQGVLSRNNQLIAETESIVSNIKDWLDQYDAKNAKPRLRSPDRELLARLRQCCESYDMSGIDKAMSELERYDYDEDADLAAWLREKIDISELAEAAQRLSKYKEG